MKIQRRNVFKRYGSAIKNWFIGHPEIVDEPSQPVPRHKRGYDGDEDDGCVVSDSDGDGGIHTRSAVTPYNVYGRSPDWADVFDTTQNVVKPGTSMVALFDIDMRSMYFHVATWLKIGHVPENWTIASYYREHQGDLNARGVLMVEQEEYEDLNQWWQWYESRVGFLDAPAALPRISDFSSISGTIVKMHEPMRSRRGIPLPNEVTFAQWCWIIENCSGKIRATDECWIFEDPAEAVMFKLADVK